MSIAATAVHASASRRPRIGPIDPELLTIFGPPPLYPGESEDDFNRLHERLRCAVGPADDLEEGSVRDAAMLLWETQRLWRMRAKLMEAAFATAVTADMGVFEQHRLLQNHAAGKVSARDEVRRKLDSPEIDRGLIEAQALSAQLTAFERIDQLIAQAEKRRMAIFREIDRHREALAKRMREAIAEIEDAEFEDLPRTEVQPT